MAPLLIVALDAANFMLALLLVTLGLVILFGLMNVINMAHGEMFLLGAYAVVLVERHGGGFWLALALAPLALAVIGLLIEELVIRHVYHRFIDTILATWGLSISLKQTVIIAFGPTAQQVDNPLPQAVAILGTRYPVYRLFIMAVAENVEIPLLSRHGLAAMLRADARTVDPQMGVGFLIPAFLSILVGGSGSLLGTLLGTTLIAGAGTVVSSIWTQITAQIVVFALAIVVIRLFPQGLTGGRG
ncbi:MAG: hypothetical protein AUH99_10300 [Candidatus Rokubacteria bacterium 13_2_20CM_2_70_11]|nr:MAG: hypothetical protein AUH99_10300 [Candidatus Rokubacteria bacterium 13_2_20CM_2_70_11]